MINQLKYKIIVHDLMCSTWRSVWNLEHLHVTDAKATRSDWDFNVATFQYYIIPPTHVDGGVS